jgi:hypothetical protein
MTGPSSKNFNDQSYENSQIGVTSKMERTFNLPVLKKKQTNLRSLVNSSDVFVKSGHPNLQIKSDDDNLMSNCIRAK